MRIAALAGLGLLTLGSCAAADTDWSLVRDSSASIKSHFEIGVGATPGMTATQAVYVRNLPGSAEFAGKRMSTVEKSFDARAWRGHRVSVSVTLKNEGGPIASAAVQVNEDRGLYTRSDPLRDLDGSSAWQTRQFVMDVGGNATTLAIRLGIQGKATGWIDAVTLTAVGDDVPVSQSQRGVTTGDWHDRIDFSPVDGKNPFDFTRGPGDPYPNVHL